MKTTRAVPSFVLALALACTQANTAIGSASEATDVASVRAVRASSNAAIAAHDIEAFTATLLPDVVVTAGNGGVLVGRDSVRASIARAFADSTFVDYVRTTDRVDVSAFKPLAAEHGHWTGHWRTANGNEEITGTYLAMWRRTDAGWRVRSEIFVSLACRGPRMCTP